MTTADDEGTGWHPVLRLDDLGDRPVQIWWQGRPWVLARLGGRVVGFADRCPHRLAPLSAGRVVGSMLECGYHGWCFDGDGQVQSVPSLGPGARLPPRARLEPLALDVRNGQICVGGIAGPG